MHVLLLLLSRFSRVQLCATPETATQQAPPSLGFSRQEHWSGLPFYQCFFFLVLCLFIIYFWSALFVAACGLFLVAVRGLLIAVAAFVLELERGC